MRLVTLLLLLVTATSNLNCRDMGFGLNCKITVGDYVYRSCHSVKIDSMRTRIGDTCTLVLPTKGVVKSQNYQAVAMDNYVKEGMLVKVELGYDGVLETRFIGYVKNVNPNDSFTLECEDEVYTLKRAAPITKTFTDISLKDLLKAFKNDITLLNSIPDITIDEWVCTNATPAEALQQLKDVYHLDIYFRGKQLFAGVAYTETNRPVHKYLVRSDGKQICNIQKDNLTYLSADNKKIQVKAISMLADNTKLETSVGDKNGETRTEYFYNIKTLKELTALANAKLPTYKVSGYEGNIVTWGLPVINHGDGMNIVDSRFKERAGTYVCDGVTDLFNENGYELTLLVGQKIS
jgi:hypothetical protein